jgi:hypothetical protein
VTKIYQKATHDFRQAYNHRSSSRHGNHADIVTRRVDTESQNVTYALGGIPH